MLVFLILLYFLITNSTRQAYNQMEEEQIIQQQPASITSKEFAAKANSKREIYQLLSQEVKAYLPQPT